jgi:hypothetical protein
LSQGCGEVGVGDIRVVAVNGPGPWSVDDAQLTFEIFGRIEDGDLLDPFLVARIFPFCDVSREF